MPEFRRLRSVWLLLAVGVLAVVAVLAIAIPPLVSGLARQPAGLVYAYDGVSHGEPAPSGQFGTLPSTDPMESVSSTAGDRVSSALFVTVVGAESAASAADNAAFDYATSADKLDHIFAAKHNFDPLVQQFGSREAVVQQFLTGLKGLTPASGAFEEQIVVGGQKVIVRGAVVDGVTKIGTAFTS